MCLIESNYRYMNMIIMYALCEHFVLYTKELLCILVSIMMCGPLEAAYLLVVGTSYWYLVSSLGKRERSTFSAVDVKSILTAIENSRISGLRLKYFVISGHYPTHLYTWRCLNTKNVHKSLDAGIIFTADLFCPSFARVLLLRGGIGLPRLNNRLLIYLLECRVWTWEHQRATVAKKSQLTAIWWYLGFQDCKIQPVNRTLEGRSVLISMSHSHISLKLCAALACTWIGVPVSTILFLDGSPIIICNNRESE